LGTGQGFKPRATIPGYHLKTDFNVLIDLQHFQQISKTVFNQYGQNLAVAIEMSIGSTNDTYFSYAKHGFKSRN
jgi:hypothetical protein